MLFRSPHSLHRWRTSFKSSVRSILCGNECDLQSYKAPYGLHFISSYFPNSMFESRRYQVTIITFIFFTCFILVLIYFCSRLIWFLTHFLLFFVFYFDSLFSSDPVEFVRKVRTAFFTKLFSFYSQIWFFWEFLILSYFLFSLFICIQFSSIFFFILKYSSMPFILI